MKHFFTLASAAMIAGSVFATAFDEEVSKLNSLLAADAPIVNDILTVRQTEWNQSGHFSNLGYTASSTGAAYADGDTFAEVERLGMAGNIIRGVALNPDGSVIIQFTTGADYKTDSSNVYNTAFNQRLRGHYVKFIPFELRADTSDKVIVNASSDHKEIQIGGWLCETYAEGDLSTADYVIFKANKIIETSSGTMEQRLVSFANQLPAPFNKCANSNSY